MDTELATVPAEPTSQPSTLEDAALYATLKKWFLADLDHSSAWRENARAEFDFVAGDQWSPQDKQTLEEQNRPCITFNRCLAIIKSVAGIEINGRHDTAFIPRGDTMGEAKLNELLTGASQWMADTCDAADEQSEAFQDTTICGMGWTEARLAYDENPDGQYDESKCDPLEMYWDKAARKKNLKDARRVARVRTMTIEEARDLAAEWGADDIDDSELDASWAVGIEGDPTKSHEDKTRRDGNGSGFLDDDIDEVRLVHMQWIEREAFHRVADVTTGRILTLNDAQYRQYAKLAKQHGLRHAHVKQVRKVYKQALLGACIIGGVRDCPGKDRFTFQCITGERHRNKGTWFGLVRLMRDPQMWANKWLSQTLHILNTTAKGGIIAEADAFKDQRAAQETYAQPDAITWAAKGAIAGNKIMQKPGAGIPTAYVNLLEFAISSIRDATGINMELLGLRDSNQPGILEAQRKQAAMTILATLFDSLKRFRKNIGRIRLHFIQGFLADGRLIRIAGPDGQQVVPLIRDQTLGEYEVIIDDAPTSPNQKQETWAFLMQLMPFFKGMMTPEVAVAMLEHSPLPTKLVETFKQMLAQNAADPAKQAQQKLVLAQGEADLDKTRAGAEKDRAAAEATRAAAVLDLAAAGSQLAATQMNAAAGNVMSPEPWKLTPIDAPNVIDPMGAAPGAPGAVPQLPQVPFHGGPNPIVREQPAPMPEPAPPPAAEPGPSPVSPA